MPLGVGVVGVGTRCCHPSARRGHPHCSSARWRWPWSKSLIASRVSERRSAGQEQHLGEQGVLASTRAKAVVALLPLPVLPVLPLNVVGRTLGVLEGKGHDEPSEHGVIAQGRQQGREEGEFVARVREDFGTTLLRVLRGTDARPEQLVHGEDERAEGREARFVTEPGERVDRLTDAGPLVVRQVLVALEEEKSALSNQVAIGLLLGVFPWSSALRRPAGAALLRRRHQAEAVPNGLHGAFCPPLEEVEDAALVLRVGPDSGDRGWINGGAVGGHDDGLDSDGLEATKERYDDVVINGALCELVRDLLADKRVRGLDEGPTVAVHLVDRELAREPCDQGLAPRRERLRSRLTRTEPAHHRSGLEFGKVEVRSSEVGRLLERHLVRDHERQHQRARRNGVPRLVREVARQRRVPALARRMVRTDEAAERHANRVRAVQIGGEQLARALLAALVHRAAARARGGRGKERERVARDGRAGDHGGAGGVEGWLMQRQSGVSAFSPPALPAFRQVTRLASADLQQSPDSGTNAPVCEKCKSILAGGENGS